MEKIDATQFTLKCQEIFRKAKDIASDKKHEFITPSHLLSAIFIVDDSIIKNLLSKYKIDYQALIEKNNYILNTYVSKNTNTKPKLSPDTIDIIKKSVIQAEDLKDSYVTIEVLFLSILLPSISSNEIFELFKSLNITAPEIKSDIRKMRIKQPVTEKNQEEKYDILEKYTLNLNNITETLDAVIDREIEIENIIQILSCRKKNNPIIIGEPGVGKTCLIHKIALKIVNGNIIDSLKNKKIFELQLSSVVAGASYKGQLEERLKSLFEEIVKSGNIILFIDDIHNLINLNGSSDAINLIKPFLSRGDIQIIGATTIDGYQKIENDKSLERRFQTVLVEEPNHDESIQILNGVKSKYEEYHSVKIDNSAIKAAVKLSEKYITDKFLPDKAISLLDEACAKSKIAEVETVTDIDVADVVSKKTGIPVSKMIQSEKDKLINLETELHKRIVGQHSAIVAVSNAIRRSRAEIIDSKKPIGSFLFMGTSGVGKTELAKALAELIFDDENCIVRVDMSEYQEKHTVSRLIGAPPGYVGYDDSGEFDVIRRKPYSIVLLDEFEKAHPDIFNILLQVLDDGRLTDSKGRIINFKNTVIIMTSNLGSYLINDKLSKINDNNREKILGETKKEVLALLKKSIRPELLNRIDETIVFDPLTKDEIKEIVKMNLKILTKNLNIKFDNTIINYVAEKGYAPEFGARPVKRVIQKDIVNELSSRLISGDIDREKEILVSYINKTIKIKNT